MEETKVFRNNKGNRTYIQCYVETPEGYERPNLHEVQTTNKGMYVLKGNNLRTKSHNKLVERLKKKLENKKN